jgi:hypothetical protein
MLLRLLQKLRLGACLHTGNDDIPDPHAAAIKGVIDLCPRSVSLTTRTVDQKMLGVQYLVSRAFTSAPTVSR